MSKFTRKLVPFFTAASVFIGCPSLLADEPVVEKSPKENNQALANKPMEPKIIQIIQIIPFFLPSQKTLQQIKATKEREECLRTGVILKKAGLERCI